ncbi:MAG: SGNH/GDSL hydrolase family protein [Flavobacteriales bacterium]|nr:SGNH/GDSL hydrolase family protein [Flavobacteriales bacterium]
MKRTGRIVVEGDSWFAYPLALDIIEHLMRMGYAIKRFSKAGDTLENIVYGTMTKGGGKMEENRGPESKERVVQAIKSLKPRFVLFSAGGNDIVGEDMLQFLHHKGSNNGPLNEERFRAHVDGPMREAIEHYVNEIWSIDPSIDILMDGYDYAKPNGEGYQVVANWAGPWVRPNFIKKGWDDRASDMEPTVKRLVDIYNEMLTGLATKHARFHHLDLRGMFPDESQWHNEIHLKKEGFKKVATVYHEKLKGILEVKHEQPEVVA